MWWKKYYNLTRRMWSKLFRFVASIVTQTEWLTKLVTLGRIQLSGVFEEGMKSCRVRVGLKEEVARQVLIKKIAPNTWPLPRLGVVPLNVLLAPLAHYPFWWRSSAVAQSFWKRCTKEWRITISLRHFRATWIQRRHSRAFVWQMACYILRGAT